MKDKSKIANVSDDRPHIPVMLDEVLDTLNIEDKKTYVDCTFGNGGYTKAILDQADCFVYSIDRDPNVKPQVNSIEEDYPNRFTFLEGTFGNIKNLLAEKNITKIDGMVLDIGVSSMQLDEAERGFSFRKDGPLDMRMGQSGLSAADIVNTMPEEELANLIYKYGEEHKSRHIAKKIVERRAETPFKTTLDLATTVQSCFPKFTKSKIDPATKTFQALRIAVNDELGELERALEASIDLLNENGRLVVVTFHSLEDGIVKSFLTKNALPKRKQNKYAEYSHHDEEQDDPTDKFFKVIQKKPLSASDKEQKSNPRSRSAKLRYATRNGNPSN
tara:strand:- start:575 stop:1567 length:993 start_codon:yes stop_codon:yes gene_type:complete